MPPIIAEPSIELLFRKIDALLAGPNRRILGLVGAPGSGKSTLAEQLAAYAAGVSVVVPMDGFHLANSELRRLGALDWKGAHDTFDSAGYVALLRRLRDQPAELVYAPQFRRDIDEPVAGVIPIMATQKLIITEGNYLLLDRGAWASVRELVDEMWYIELPQKVRLQRLIAGTFSLVGASVLRGPGSPKPMNRTRRSSHRPEAERTSSSNGPKSTAMRAIVGRSKTGQRRGAIDAHVRPISCGGYSTREVMAKIQVESRPARQRGGAQAGPRHSGRGAARLVCGRSISPAFLRSHSEPPVYR